MFFRGFWDNLAQPIVGLAPMDGVTDAAFRYMVCKHSRPSVVYTEFTNVEGLARGAAEMLKAFIYSDIERPIVAQIFGVEVDSFYKCAVMLCSLGFDGIDINMGCPAKKIEKKGSGASLIKTPELAKKLIRATKQGIRHWAEGITLEKAGVHPDIIKACEKMRAEEFERREIPVSVKTRIGYDKIVADEWAKHLLEERPACISMHGRTLNQGYKGQADWDVLGEVARVCHDSGTLFLGNGDVKSMQDALEKIEKYGVDGVLVGRAALGNPWFFGDHEPSTKDRLDVVIEHSEYFSRVLGNRMAFHNLKKHLAWYCREFNGSRELRFKLMRTSCIEDVKILLSPVLQKI